MKIFNSNPIQLILMFAKKDKQTIKGKKQALNMDIFPSYQTRQVQETSVKNRIDKANKINYFKK